MKDEELAEEYAEKYFGKKTELVEVWKLKSCKENFLAGLKAGRPQWHDLQKNPNDLPKHTNQVIGYCRGDYYDICFSNGKILIGHGENDFLKWKEIE
jgi:hypothetical protein